MEKRPATLARPGLLVSLLLGGAILAPRAAWPQGLVDPDHGVIAVSQILRGLGQVKRVLVIGAHPDDEDTSLLAALVRGGGADAAYLALTRGEGGQNLIGPELGVGLGLLRTEELLAARRLDGARQFFTRAYDFGYSKSADETFSLWPRDSLLADVVFVIRTFRPQVVVSTFSGTRRDGHGQHRAAGILASEAFDAAGDPHRFPGQLTAGREPWSPLKLYRSTRFDPASATLALETGQFDEMLGRSYSQIAAASRSRHRSQDMGRVESLGPRRTSLQLVESRAGPEPSRSEMSLFDGVDTTLVGLVRDEAPGPRIENLSRLLGDYSRTIQEARRELGSEPELILPQLKRALALLREAQDALEGESTETALQTALAAEEKALMAALVEAADVILDVRADDDLIVPGQALTVDTEIWNGGRRDVVVEAVQVEAPEAWQIEPASQERETVPGGALVQRTFQLSVPVSAEPTRPYFLRQEMDGAIYRWPPDARERAQPLGDPIIVGRVRLVIDGMAVERELGAVHRFADQAVGEIRRPVYVVPVVGLSLAPPVTIWPLSRDAPVSLKVTLRGEAPSGVSGKVWIEAPDSWTVEPPDQQFKLPGEGRTATVSFRVTAGRGVRSGRNEFRAVAATPSSQQHRLGYSIIDYPHIRRNLLFEEAVAQIVALPLEVDRTRKIAYVPGASDAVADAIAAMGVPLEVLDGDATANADLEAYDVIVVGIRAYETNPSLAAANDRLLKWVRSGGTLIVQYQQYRFFDGDYAPYPLQARRPHDRVTDETAPMTILVPSHALFTKPNRIEASDFDGWVQERGLYFAAEWDDRYLPLLETADAGESAKRGVLLFAEYGKGIYVYTGLSLFRQLPAGVPGAYRLLANLLTLKR